MDVRLQRFAARQADIVAAWQLVAVGWSRDAVAHAARAGSWRRMHSGVFALTHSPLTRWQLWMAATLTTPDSFLSHASGGAAHRFRPWEGRFEVVTRPGNGGRRRIGPLLVCRSRTLDGDTTVIDGLRITTAERTLLDLAGHLDRKSAARAFREAIRLKTTTPDDLLHCLRRHGQRRGTKLLHELALRYRALPYARAKSNAEARAMELLHDDGVEPPLVNVRIAGEEADLVWPRHRRIVEIDGPQYHRFADEDARKQRLWEDAGYVVRRIPSDDVFDAPHRLLALAPR